MGKHSLPRTRAPFWTALVIGGAVVVGATLAAVAPPTVDYDHTAPAPAATATRQPEAHTDAEVAADNDDLHYAQHHIAPAEAPAAVTEDSPAWDCTMMGDHICGPDNPQGKAAGRYDQGGVLVETWDQPGH